MSDRDQTPPNLRADAFVGVAADYALYRPPYPDALLTDLTVRAGVSGQGRLLDMACGPGRIALALAPLFREVSAVDLEPGMIAEGRRQAGLRGISNVRWSVGRAEDFAATPAAYELITVGEAFHRLDRPRVAASALTWLAPGGCLGVIGADGVLEGGEPWQPVVRDHVRRWTGLGTGAAGAPVISSPDNSPAGTETLLRRVGFAEATSFSLEVAHVWTMESLLGYLRTTSYASRHALGGKADAFEAELRAALIACDPAGRYRQRLGFGYTLARAPGACPIRAAGR